MKKASQIGRVIGHSPEARAHQAEKQRRDAAALKKWKPSEQPEWLTENSYREEIQPRLRRITVPAIASALGLSQLPASQSIHATGLPLPLFLPPLVRSAQHKM